MFRDHDEMTHPRLDAATAAGTGVDLAGLIRLDRFDNDRSSRGVLHALPAQQRPEHDEQCDHNERDDDDQVGFGSVLLAKWIESHGAAA